MTKYLTVLFKKHKKHLPKKLEGIFIGELLRYGIFILISAWIFQGMLYMNWRETVIKILLDLLILLILFYCGINIIVAFIIAHTLNFAFNGQLFAMFTHQGATNVSPESFLNNTLKMAGRIKKTNYIDAAIAYGSLSRGCYKKTSDIDVRFIPKKGKWWRTALFAVKERIIAFINGYPLDLYVFDSEILIKKMRSDELPIILYENEEVVQHIYKKHVPLDEFVNIFKQNNFKVTV